jgi:hypothetical protein
MVIRPSIRVRLTRLVARQRARLKVETVVLIIPGLALFAWSLVDLGIHGRKHEIFFYATCCSGMMLTILAGVRMQFLQRYDRRADFLNDPVPVRSFELSTSQRWFGKERVLTLLPLEGPRLNYPLPRPQDDAFEASLSVEIEKLLEDDEHSVLA